MTHPYPHLSGFFFYQDVFNMTLTKFPLCTSWPIKTRCKVCQHETEREYIGYCPCETTFCFSLQISLASNLLKVSANVGVLRVQKYHNDRTKRRWGIGVSVHGGREGFYQRRMFLLFTFYRIWQA